MPRGALARVAEIYRRLDVQISKDSELVGNCTICGKCCDFAAFDHRLFVTTPELIYLAAKQKPKQMHAARCPYNLKNSCTIYDSRFAGCRIFCCGGDADFQSKLSESVIKQFKSICEEFRIPYRYSELSEALNNFTC